MAWLGKAFIDLRIEPIQKVIDNVFSVVSPSLSKLIECEEWDMIIHLCEIRPLDASISLVKNNCFEEGLTSELLPLHLALLKSQTVPFEVIESLIIAFPEGVREKETLYNRLPLHIACEQNAPLRIIRTLIAYYREGPSIQDYHGRIPLHYSCFNGAPLEIVDILLQNYQNGVQLADHKCWLPIHIAMKYNSYFEVSQRLLAIYPECVNRKTLKGSTPLMCAETSTFKNKSKLVSLLKGDVVNILPTLNLPISQSNTLLN